MRNSRWDIPAALTNNVRLSFPAGCQGQPDALLLGPVVHFLRRYWIAQQRKLNEKLA
jgi:hypothetical protein